MSFYRKYRPQTLDQLIGQDHIKQALLNSFKSDKLSHAYLFCGPRGTGKTSTARILAKMVNCQSQESSNKSQVKKAESDSGLSILETGDSTIPCNQCSSCVSITEGSNMDVYEIDAASNRGIDDIRELRDKIKLAPSSSKKKVYIIDEVHMLTTEAFNALLKTLEEPPAHVLFILATTEVHKLPQTILSRVQRFNFELAASESIKSSLKKIIDSEKLEIEEEALDLIIKKGGGSFRDSQKILDQIASFGEKITRKMVEETIKSGNNNKVLELLTIISEKDVRKGLELLSNAVQEGVNIKDFSEEFLETLRLILLYKNGAKVEMDKTSEEDIKQLTAKFESEEIIRLLTLVQESLEKMKYSSIPSLGLEIAVVEACTNQVSSIMGQVSSEEKSSVILSPIKSDLSVNEGSLTNVSNPSDKLRDSSSTPQNDVIDSSLLTPHSSLANESFTGSDDSSDKAKLLDKWQFILETIRPYNYSLEALLKQAKLLNCNDGVAVLEVPYSFHQRILEAPKSRTLLESVFADVLGKTVTVSVALGNRPVRIEELANVEVAADDEIVKIAAEIFNS